MVRRARPKRLRLMGLVAGSIMVLASLAAPGVAAVPDSAQSGVSNPMMRGRCQHFQFFVSPDGKDHPGPSTKQRPWRTITHARDYIRANNLNSARMRCDIVVNLRAGIYRVDKPVQFTDQDSGNNGHQVIYRSYDGPGKARFLGAKPVDGWQQYDGHIYRTHVDTSAESYPFYTLYEDGQRATMARYPNSRSANEWGPYLFSVIPEPEKQANHQWLYAKKGVWDPDWNTDDAQMTVWSGGGWSWFTDTVGISNANGDQQISLAHWTRYSLVNSDGGSRYFLQNSLDWLDQPGEYYLDYDKGLLYYWPRSGSIQDSEIWAPTVKTVFDIAGASTTQRVHDLVLDGLAVQYTDFVKWYRYAWISSGDSGHRHKYPVYDRQIEMPRNRFGAITMTNTRRVDLQRMHISDTGFMGVYMLFANDHDTVSGSLIENIGADGIKIEGPYPGEGDVSHHNVLTNNYIHHIGELVPGDAAGVEILNSGHNEVSHSVIRHSARYAVSLETRPEVTNADNYAEGNVLKYLRISDVVMDSLEAGALYAYGVDNFEPFTRNSVMKQITIEDVTGAPWLRTHFQRGVHMDFGGCGFVFANIEVTNVRGDDYHGDDECNDFDNVSWNVGFDAAQMQYDKIGVLPDFPYSIPTPDATLHVDDPVAGQQTTATVTLTNSGPDAANNASVSLSMPAGWKIKDDATKDLGELDVGETATVTWQVTPPAGEDALEKATLAASLDFQYGGSDGTSQNGSIRDYLQLYVQSPVQDPYKTFASTDPAYFGQAGKQLAIATSGSGIDDNKYGAIYRSDAAKSQATAVVKVTKQEATYVWAEAGLIMRNDVADVGSAGLVTLQVSPIGTVILKADTDGDGVHDQITGAGDAGAAPIWLKIVRDGSTYTGFYSHDGTTWSKVGTATVTGDQQQVDAGVFMTSAVADLEGIATFEHFQVTNS